MMSKDSYPRLTRNPRNFRELEKSKRFFLKTPRKEMKRDNSLLEVALRMMKLRQLLPRTLRS
jgi:hypothetical protein